MKRASEQWMESAEMDIGNIEQIIRREDLTPVAAFHSQQCVERCFKAVLEEHAKKVPKEHSTLKLYGLAKEWIPFEVDMEILTDLDGLYIESRYPGELGLLPNGKPTLADAQQFYAFAQSVYRQIKRMLNTRDCP